MKRLIQYIKDSIGELRKVNWPTRESVISSTKIVIVSTIIIAVGLGAIDFLLVLGLEAVF